MVPSLIRLVVWCLTPLIVVLVLRETMQYYGGPPKVILGSLGPPAERQPNSGGRGERDQNPAPPLPRRLHVPVKDWFLVLQLRHRRIDTTLSQ